MKKVQIRVPATSANMGPGFDCLGVALSLYLEITITPSETLVFQGCPKEYQNTDNVIYQAFSYVYEAANLAVPTVTFMIDSQIPTARGLGSSAACIVAGLFGANALLDNRYTTEELFTMANAIEGHPDNIAPAIYGGLTASFIDSNQPYVVKFDIDKRFCFGALIPDFELSTAKARSVLPKQLTYQDCVYNLSRAAVLAKALETYLVEVIRKAMQDRLHEPYRKSLIENFDDIRNHALQAGALGVYLSGAGPTMMIVCDQINTLDKINSTLQNDQHWRLVSLQPNLSGIQIKEETSWRNI